MGLLLLAGLGLAALLALWLSPDFRPDAPADRPLPAAALPDHPLRIVAFGTSLTARALWPERLAADLTRCLGHPVMVDRIARPGADSGWGLAQAGQVLEARPDIVVIEFAINDADLFDGVSLDTSVARHLQLIGRLTEGNKGPAVLLMTTNPVASGWRRVQRLRLGAYYLAYRGLAAQTGSGLADLWPRWTVPIGGDGLHPDPEAEAEVALPVLTRLIADRHGKSCEAGGD